jgi:beta-lactamase class D
MLISVYLCSAFLFLFLFMNRFYTLSLCLCSILSFVSCRDARIHEHKDWGKFYEEAGIKNAGIILRDQTHDAVHYYNLQQDTAHFLPASTFKILLSLVAVELGILQDDKFIIPFNGDSSGHPEWDKDLNLREAFELSSEPFFKEVARRIGKENLQHFLDTVRYGNKTIGDSVTSCWTDNSLKISADEQVGFLRKMYFNQLPFTDRTQRIVRSLMLHDNKNGQKLYYKTGWGKNDSAAILWVVGFAEYEVKIKEKEGSMNKSGERNYVYFFAQNFELPQAETDQNKWSAQRIDLLQKVLSHHVSQSQQAQ